MKFLSYICLIGFLFLGCKKYPEDGKISLQTVKHRLIKGEWKLQKFYINGSDSSQHVYSSFVDANGNLYEWKYFNCTLDLLKEESREHYKSYQATGSLGVHIWYLSDKKDYLFLGITGEKVFGIDNPVVWVIKKLTKEELIITADKNGNTYEIEFKKHLN